MPEQWPVPGHKGWYKARVKLDNGYELTCDLPLPGAMPEWHLSTARLGRHGGEIPADQMFRQKLYVRIGAVTVAGGHAETAMKRLLLLLAARSPSSRRRKETWTV